jgi:hypothetical protein
MNGAVPDALVRGYERHIGGLTLPDPDDRHVLAAAIASKSSVIVTFNLADFPARALRAYGIRAMDPDDFLVMLFESSGESVCAAIKRVRARLRRPAMTVGEYIACLERQRLNKFVARLRSAADLL